MLLLGHVWCQPWLRDDFTAGTGCGILLHTAEPFWAAAETRIVRTHSIVLMPEWIQTLTVDASYNATTGVTGVAIIIQHRVGLKGRGPIIEEVAEGYSNVALGAGELLAIFRALDIARQRGFIRIKVRSDYNAMRHKLRHDLRSGRTDIGLRGCVLLLARTFEWVDFGYVPRRKNHLAHGLARRARNLIAHAWSDPVWERSSCS